MERRITIAPGEYYHVYNRGVEKRDIFIVNGDRLRFQRLLYIANGTNPVVYKSNQGRTLDEIDRGKPMVALGAYCLMTNHFHLLIKETQEGGISEFVKKLTTGYSMYFNKTNKRVGPLFQSRFKAEHVDNDEYLKYLFAYINLNPMKLIDPEWKEKGIRDAGKAKQYLEQYAYSSYLDHQGKEREEKLILSPEEFPGYFATAHEFDEYLQDWLAYREENESDESPIAQH